MKYRKDGMVYRLVPFRGDCTECAFHNQSCEYLPSCDYEGRGTQAMWRETIPSKIRGWLRGGRH